MDTCHLCGAQTNLYIDSKPICQACAEQNRTMKPSSSRTRSEKAHGDQGSGSESRP